MAAVLRLLVCALAALLLCAAPARAAHGADDHGVPEASWEDEGWGDGDGQGAVAEEQDPAWQPAPATLPDTTAELPAEPWQPSAAPALPVVPQITVPKAKIIKGRRALVRADGKAAIPRGAPKRVRVAIAAANRLIGKPYKWGGGHGRLVDSGYDCSGSVGFSLVHAGLMPGVMVSGQMARWAHGGGGRWITVYANAGHVYMEIAGLRLDTSAVGDPSGRTGPRWRPVIGRRPGFKARHPAGL
jgi:hypothetical protein